MGEEAYVETIFSTVHGWICLRGGYGRRHTYLGVSRRPYEDGDDPDVTIMLPRAGMERLRDHLTDALDDMGGLARCSCCGDPASDHVEEKRECKVCECKQYET